MPYTCTLPWTDLIRLAEAAPASAERRLRALVADALAAARDPATDLHALVREIDRAHTVITEPAEVGYGRDLSLADLIDIARRDLEAVEEAITEFDLRTVPVSR